MNHTQLERMATERFGLSPVAPVRPVRAGNINRTAVIETEDGSFVLQEMNISVFPFPSALMSNTLKIIERQREHSLPALSFLQTTSGEWLAELDGTPWRCYRFVEGGATPDILTPEDAQRTARAFGRFAKAIDGLDLVEHVEGYHDFDQRVGVLEFVVDADELDRVQACAQFVDDLLSVIDRLRLTSGYKAWKRVPVRNSHNDAKGPNCIVDLAGNLTVIDLDTTMPGTVLADIGELVRSSTRHLPDAGPEQLWAQIQAVNRGFVAGFVDDLTDTEREAMLLAGPLMAVENAVRFLADHLSGDKYYGAESPNQNLDRAIVQYELGRRLVGAIEWATTS